MEKEMGIVTVTGKDALVVTDKYGDSLIVEKYHHRIDDEERVQLSLDNEKIEFRDILEENDVKVDLSKEEFVASLKAVLGALEDEEPKSMVLSDEEIKIIETYRKGATVELGLYNGFNKEEAYEEVEKYGEVVLNESNGHKWYTNTIRNNVRATVFYE